MEASTSRSPSSMSAASSGQRDRSWSATCRQAWRARLIGAVLLEQNDEWQLQHRYMQVEAMAELTAPVAEAEPAQIPPQAA